MITTMRALLVATLFAVTPVLCVTLQTLRMAGSQEMGRSPQELMAVREETNIEDVKLELAGGAKSIHLRKTKADGLPVSDFFRSGFAVPTLGEPSGRGDVDKAWDGAGNALFDLNNAKMAFEVVEAHVGRETLSSFSEDQFHKFAADLEPFSDSRMVVTLAPGLKGWPQKLIDRSVETTRTKEVRNQLGAITEELEKRLGTEGVSLIRIPEVDLRKWSQQLTVLKKPKNDALPIEKNSLIFEEINELQRQLDFWNCWNPPITIGTGKPTAATLESCRKDLMQLQEKAKVASKGTAKLSKEIDHVEQVAIEIARLAGEVNYVNFKETLASKKNGPKSITELMQRMQSIIETGSHAQLMAQDGAYAHLYKLGLNAD